MKINKKQNQLILLASQRFLLSKIFNKNIFIDFLPTSLANFVGPAMAFFFRANNGKTLGEGGRSVSIYILRFTGLSKTPSFLQLLQSERDPNILVYQLLDW